MCGQPDLCGLFFAKTGATRFVVNWGNFWFASCSSAVRRGCTLPIHGATGAAKEPIRPPKFRPPELSIQNGKLLAKGQVFQREVRTQPRALGINENNCGIWESGRF